MNSKQLALGFLEELDTAVADIMNKYEQIVSLVEQLYRAYNEWVDVNSDVSRSEAFKNLEKDIKALYQTCKFLGNDCLDVRHSISDAGVEFE